MREPRLDSTHMTWSSCIEAYVKCMNVTYECMSVFLEVVQHKSAGGANKGIIPNEKSLAAKIALACSMDKW